MKSYDYLIIGAGINGLAVALELKKRNPESKILLIEKENACAKHASGRNSGVLHAGFYYTANSLKAKLTQAGNVAMTAYCERNRLPINKCGKLVVAQNASELTQLDELLKRAKANGVPLEMITAEQAKRIEPRVRTYQRALFSPTTSSIDPKRVNDSLREDVIQAGIEIRTAARYLGFRGSLVQTSAGDYQAGYVVNCAGLQADQIAHNFGFAHQYRILPFKGLYLKSTHAYKLKTNIYPVPNLANPFLGVHFTVTVDGHVKIGPNAIPALWREQYAGWTNYDFREMREILLRQISLFVHSTFDFKRLAWSELQKQSSHKLVALAARLAEDVHVKDFREWGQPGIRAQLINTHEHSLVMDFVIEGDASSCHILNSISPGYTCAFPFAKLVCDKIRTFQEAV